MFPIPIRQAPHRHPIKSKQQYRTAEIHAKSRISAPFQTGAFFRPTIPVQVRPTAFLLLGNQNPLTGVSPLGTGINLSISNSNLSYTLQAGSSTLCPTILLQRLACPYIAFNATTNPFIAVDIFQNACQGTTSGGSISTLNNVTNAVTSASDGRINPFMDHLGGPYARISQPTAPQGTQVKDSFQAINSNETGTNQWLVQLDRYLSIPIELLHVPGCKPRN